jgi:signal transduction histidine kinase
MAEHKEVVLKAIASAQAELETAVSELHKIPSFDASAVTFAAHAVNNYLTVASGTIELILMRLADHEDPLVRLGLESTQHALGLMGRIVGQLTKSSAAGGGVLRREEFDLVTLAQRACSYHQPAAERKSIRLTVTAGIDVPPAFGDRVMAAAVLENLLTNAIKYSPPGKNILVEVRSDKDGVVCSVQDEGPGLSRDDQARLFQRGARLTPKPTGGEVSIGYGLAVAKELIDQLGGKIWCRSTLGHGAEFSFRLPAFEEPADGNR